MRGGDVVDVSCVAKFGTGKTFTLVQRIVKADGTVSAEIDGVFGVMDLDARKLFADPRATLESAGLDTDALLG
jgi:acyl-CoA thioester hydrolase